MSGGCSFLLNLMDWSLINSSYVTRRFVRVSLTWLHVCCRDYTVGCGFLPWSLTVKVQSQGRWKAIKQWLDLKDSTASPNSPTMSSCHRSTCLSTTRPVISLQAKSFLSNNSLLPTSPSLQGDCWWHRASVFTLADGVHSHIVCVAVCSVPPLSLSSFAVFGRERVILSVAAMMGSCSKAGSVRV